MDKIIIRKPSEYPLFKEKDYSIYTNEKVIVNDTLKNIFKKGKVTLPSGEIVKLQASVSPKEGIFIYDLVRDNKFKRCLEIGMANGISALYICQALKDNNLKDSILVSIDPNQSTQWKNSAVNHLKIAGLSEYSILAEKKSYIALPEILNLVEKKEIEKFDMIFIDGMHLFDYTLADFFYADLLLKVGGVIVLDDIRHAGVKAFYEYAMKNYTHYKLLKTVTSDTMGVFVKIKEDERDWNFHIKF